MARNVRYEDIHVGDKASLSKTISEYDVYAFAGVTGDFNPVHVNAEFAKNSLFKQRIAHGMISAGLISAVLGIMGPLSRPRSKILRVAVSRIILSSEASKVKLVGNLVA